ncbi:hypothetical protein ACGF0J_29730 [Nonomuraea sp. NPDC047897]
MNLRVTPTSTKVKSGNNSDQYGGSIRTNPRPVPPRLLRGKKGR